MFQQRRTWLSEMVKTMRAQSGFVVPLVLSYMLIFSMVAAGLVGYSGHTARLINVEKNKMRTFYMAEAATDQALAQVRLFFDQMGVMPTAAQLDTMTDNKVHGGSEFSFANADPSDPTAPLTMEYKNPDGSNSSLTQGALTVGDYTGLNGQMQNIKITANLKSDKGGKPEYVTMTQNVQVQIIPIFQFGVFYEEDLEILPGNKMTFVGPVHTNGNLYARADVAPSGDPTMGLNFTSSITAYGDIFARRKDGNSINSGPVNIDDGAGDPQNMYQGSIWLDSAQSNWAVESQNRWDGNVQSAAHNVRSLNLPLPTGSDAHTLIVKKSGSDSAQVQAQKIDYKAHIRMINGVVTTQGGTPLDFRYCRNGSGSIINTNIDTKGTSTLSDDACIVTTQTLVRPITATTYYDFREKKTMQSTDVNIGQLNLSPTFQTIMTSAPTGVIFYHSDRRNLGSSSKEDTVRLTNGAQLPTHGLTFASEQALYIKGDFNSVNKQPAGILSDAFNIQSNAWSDSNASNTSLSSRTASNTTINAAIITGNVDTVAGGGITNYSGGFENFSRFHETWSGKTLTYKGSVVVLYNSETATGKWSDASYSPPVRVWNYDLDLADPTKPPPPGFPNVVAVMKSTWKVGD